MTNSEARKRLAERDAGPVTTFRAAVEALADEWDFRAQKWPYAHWAETHKAHARDLRALLAAYPPEAAPEAPEATEVEWGLRWRGFTNVHDEKRARALVSVMADEGATLVRRTVTRTPWVEVETTTEGGSDE